MYKHVKLVATTCKTLVYNKYKDFVKKRYNSLSTQHDY